MTIDSTLSDLFALKHLHNGVVPPFVEETITWLQGLPRYTPPPVAETKPGGLLPWEIMIDGGCHGNPGQMYGSFALDPENLDIPIQRVNFGHGTNNQAEYRTAIAAVEELLHIHARASEFIFKTDSRLLVGQIFGLDGKIWKINDETIHQLHKQLFDLLEQLRGDWRFVWVPREEIVKVLGH